MTKRKIRYSELASPPAAEPQVQASVAPVEVAPPAAPPIAPPMPPRPRRNSSPVELAHALAAARAAESAAAALSVQAERPQEQPVPRLVDAPALPMVELLVFRVADERFAVELLAVEEVIDLPVIHHVPEMPPAMLGVVAVRGSLTPVYSPHVALGLPLAMRAAVLIFQRGSARVGVLIDDVDDAISLDVHELRAAYSAADGDNVVLGVVRHDEMLIAIVDVDALIAACQQAAFQEIA